MQYIIQYNTIKYYDTSKERISRIVVTFACEVMRRIVPPCAKMVDGVWCVLRRKLIALKIPLLRLRGDRHTKSACVEAILVNICSWKIKNKIQ